MREVIITKEPVILNGHSAIIPQYLVKRLEDGRNQELKMQLAKVSNPESIKIKPAPWQEIKGNLYKATFTWNEEKTPEVVDQDYKTLVDQRLTIDSTITAKLIFIQTGYLAGDQQSIGTKLTLKGLQVMSRRNIDDPWLA